MFQINDDLSITITRGDTAVFCVDVVEESGANYLFQSGDVIRIKVTEKKACENVMFQKDFVVAEETEQVEIVLTEEDTKIGEVISKPTDYWYEIELNPLTNPQTIIGYDDDGAKIFKLFPEGKDIEPSEDITPEDIPVVDEELDLTSERPVQNHVIAKAFLSMQEEIAKISGDTDLSNMLTKDDLKPLESDIATITGKVEDITTTIDTHTTSTNPHNVTAEQIRFDDSGKSVKGAIDEIKGNLNATNSNVTDVQTQLDDRYSHNTNNIQFPFTAPHSGMLTFCIALGSGTAGVLGNTVSVNSNGYIRHHHCGGYCNGWGALSFQIPLAKGDIVTPAEQFTGQYANIYAERTYFTY